MPWSARVDDPVEAIELLAEVTEPRLTRLASYGVAVRATGHVLEIWRIRRIASSDLNRIFD